MSSYSLFCFFLIVQSVAPGLNYCTLFNPCSECSIINFLMFPHYWFPMALLIASQCPANTMCFVAACEVSSGSPMQRRLQLNCSAGLGHPWWDVSPGHLTFHVTSNPYAPGQAGSRLRCCLWQSFPGSNGATKTGLQQYHWSIAL